MLLPADMDSAQKSALNSVGLMVLAGIWVRLADAAFKPHFAVSVTG
jgi:hypothetical protein